MSCYEWEGGDIKLPTNEVKNVRDAVWSVFNKRRADALVEAQNWYTKATPTRNRDKFREQVYAQYYDDKLSQDAIAILMATIGDTYGYDRDGNWVKFPARAPRKPIEADVTRVLGRKLTNRDTQAEFDEIRISFNGRVLGYYVSENNHACDRAHDHPVVQALMAALRKVTWTRGSGGDIIGNNEYNRDDQSVGGGGNYLVHSFGPVKKSKVRGRF